MSGADLGGDPPCWAHLLDEQGEQASAHDGDPEIVDLAAVSVGSGGAIWSLPHGGDLDANLVRLDPATGIDAHTNNDVDVLVLVQSGTANLTVDGQTRQVGADHLALIPKGSNRSIMAGAAGVTYLSIHRQRSPLGITRRVSEGSSK